MSRPTSSSLIAKGNNREMAETNLRIAAITDEFSPDLDTALNAMRNIGMTGAELRVIGSKNILDLSDDEIARAREALVARGFEVVSIASPVLKCVLPGAPAVDTRFQHNAFSSLHPFHDHPHLTTPPSSIA